MNSRPLVGFFIQNPFHYFLYESIINELVKQNVNCHLLLSDSIKGDPEWGEMYTGLIKFIEGLERSDIEAYLVSTVQETELLYDCVISPFYTEEIKNLGSTNIRIMYSLAKESWTYSWWNVFYDKILCYGKYDYSKLNIYDSCSIIGNPKFDYWYNDSMPSNEKIVKYLNINIDYNKKTILYCPTYGSLSSIDVWLDEIYEIQNDYNIIIKLHHGTSYLVSENYRKEKIINSFSNVYNDSTNLLYLLKICDTVITDNSGVIFDALLAEKNIILLNTEAEFKNTDFYSAEMKIRRELVNLNYGESIRLKLNEQKSENKEICIINNLKREYYDYLDGKSGLRAARIILKTISERENLDNKLLLSLREKMFR